jgi:hypothetical protein
MLTMIMVIMIDLERRLVHPPLLSPDDAPQPPLKLVEPLLTPTLHGNHCSLRPVTTTRRRDDATEPLDGLVSEDLPSCFARRGDSG